MPPADGRTWYKRLEPAVPRNWLLLLAGLMWAAVGLMLCRLAYIWLSFFPFAYSVIFASGGVLLALAIYRLGFSRVARKNARRLCSLPGKVCIFAFQAWTGYLIIAVMMTMGIQLRHSPLPKELLAAIYIMIGGALILGSGKYFRCLGQPVRQ